MIDEKRKDQICLVIGRLECIKHSMHWLMAPPHVRESISHTTEAEAIHAKAEGLRDIADSLDELANDVGGPKQKEFDIWVEVRNTDSKKPSQHRYTVEAGTWETAKLAAIDAARLEWDYADITKGKDKGL